MYLVYNFLFELIIIINIYSSRTSPTMLAKILSYSTLEDHYEYSFCFNNVRTFYILYFVSIMLAYNIAKCK